MYERLFELAEDMIEMSDMEEKDKKRLQEIMNNMEKLDDVKINSIEDIRREVDFEFEEIDFDDMEDVEMLLEKIDKLPIDDFVDEDVDVSKEGISDFFDKDSRFKYNSEPDEVDVDVDDGAVDVSPYQDENWVEFDTGYETFVEIPDDAEDTEISITLEEDCVTISEPVDESIDISKVPDDIDSVEVEMKGENLLVRIN